MKIKELTYFTSFFFRNILGDKGEPLILGLGLTNKCNLACQHCVLNSGQYDLSYEKAVRFIKSFYRQGARILFMQGGEVFLWKDKGHTVEDLVSLAKNLGYFKVALTTNGTFPIRTGADLVWVSVDGKKENHNKIRNRSFDTVLKNLKESTHPKITINMTINRINLDDIEEVADLTKTIPSIKGVSYNFHTPFIGVEDLTISAEARKACLERIILLKKQGYPVANSYASLQAQQRNSYPRPTNLIYLVEKGKAYPCCFGREEPGVCKDCGYGIIAELSLLSRGNVNVMLEATKLFG